jgi:hypothetical protein
MNSTLPLTGESAVQSLIEALSNEGIAAEWHNTGGGCYAIRIPFGVSESHPYGSAEILVTDREDVFTAHDYAHDDHLWGFFARAYRLESDGATIDDDDSEGWLYCTGDEGLAAYFADEDEVVVDLETEVREVFAAIMSVVKAGRIGTIELPHERNDR